MSQSASCRWIGRSFCVAVLELRPPSEGLQSLSRDESRGRNWSPSLHNAHSSAPSSIYYFRNVIGAVSQKSLAWGVDVDRGSSSPVAGCLSVCPSVCLHRNERFCVQLVLVRKSAFHARIPGFETHLVKRIKHNSQCCKANERSLKRQWEVFMI